MDWRIYLKIKYDGSTWTDVFTGVSSGTMSLRRSILEKALAFGTMYASEFACQLYNTDVDLSGMEIRVVKRVTDEETQQNTDTNLFTGLIDSSTTDYSGSFRDIVAYDAFYYKRQENLADWWTSYWTTHASDTITVKDIREAVVAQVGLTAVSRTLTNDSQVITPEIAGVYSQITFEDILHAVSEITATFPIINGDGEVDWIYFRTNDSQIGTGKNLLRITATDSTVDGVTFTINPNGTVTVDGTASANITFDLGSIEMEQGVAYYMSGCPSGGSVSTYSLYAGLNDIGEGAIIVAELGAQIGDDITPIGPVGTLSAGNDVTVDLNGNSYTVLATDGDTEIGHTRVVTTTSQTVSIKIGNGTVANNLVFKPMVMVIPMAVTTEEDTVLLTGVTRTNVDPLAFDYLASQTSYSDNTLVLGYDDSFEPYNDGYVMLDEGMIETASAEYQDYDTALITEINILDTQSNIMLSYGNDNTNPFSIMGNFLLNGMSTQQLESVCANILDKIDDLTYNPCSINLIYTNWDIDLGIAISTPKGRSFCTGYELTGIQLVQERVEAVAPAEYQEVVTYDYNMKMATAKKYSKIEQSIDGIVFEVGTLEGDVIDLSTRVTQTETDVSTLITDVGGIQTMIREYSGGVLVCKTGSTIGALVNANGSFDVVTVTWSTATPDHPSVPTAGNVLWRGSSNGTYIYDSSGNAIGQFTGNGVTLGDTDTSYAFIDANGLRVHSIIDDMDWGDFGEIRVGTVKWNDTGDTDPGPYVTLGVRNRTNGIGLLSVAEGSGTEASGSDSHSEGTGSVASALATHAEGSSTASYQYAHAEGNLTTASGNSAHSEGQRTIAAGAFSHAGGLSTIANGNSQTAIGKYNVADSTSLFLIGNGSSSDARSNAFKVDTSGNVTAAGNITASNIGVENLLPSVYQHEQASDTVGNTRVINDITWTVNRDGSITANGTASADSAFYLSGYSTTGYNVSVIYLDPDKNYVLSGCPSGGTEQTYYLQVRATVAWITPSTSTGTVYKDFGSGVTFTRGKYGAVAAVVRSGVQVSNITFYPMLEVGTSASPYQSTHLGTYALNQQLRGVTENLGVRVNEEQSTAINVATETATNVNSIAIETGHTYIVTAHIDYPSNNVGRRGLFVSSTSGSTTAINSAARMIVPAVDGAATRITCTFIMRSATTSTLYLTAYQASGSTLAVTSYMDVVRLI